MKIQAILCAAFFLVLFSAPVYSQRWARSTKYINGYKYTSKITEEELQKLPLWKPGTEEAPLSVGKAVEIAQKNFDRFLPQFAIGDWKLDTIALDNLGENKWFYSVDFICHSEECLKLDFVFTIFVKMDGTIAEPEIEQNDGKSRVY